MFSLATFEKHIFLSSTALDIIVIVILIIVAGFIVFGIVKSSVEDKKDKIEVEKIVIERKKEHQREASLLSSPIFKEISSAQDELRKNIISGNVVLILTNKANYIKQLNYSYEINDELIVPMVSEIVSEEEKQTSLLFKRLPVTGTLYLSRDLGAYDHWKYYYDNYDDIMNAMSIDDKNRLAISEYREEVNKIWRKYKNYSNETYSYDNYIFAKNEVDDKSSFSYDGCCLEIKILVSGKKYYSVYFDYPERVKERMTWLAPYMNEKARRTTFIQKQRKLMSDSLRFDVLKRDGYKCVLCGSSSKDGVKLHVDHILPLSRGGKTELNNLQTLCERCNSGKSTKEM